MAISKWKQVQNVALCIVEGYDIMWDRWFRQCVAAVALTFLMLVIGLVSGDIVFFFIGLFAIVAVSAFAYRIGSKKA